MPYGLMRKWKRHHTPPCFRPFSFRLEVHVLSRLASLLLRKARSFHSRIMSQVLGVCGCVLLVLQRLDYSAFIEWGPAIQFKCFKGIGSTEKCKREGDQIIQTRKMWGMVWLNDCIIIHYCINFFSLLNLHENKLRQNAALKRIINTKSVWKVFIARKEAASADTRMQFNGAYQVTITCDEALDFT